MRTFLLAAFAASYSLTRWRRQRFTDAGTAVLVVLAITAMLSPGALHTRMDILCLFTATLLCCGLPIMLWFPRRGRALLVKRNLPRFVSIGKPFSYRLEVVNSGNRTLSGLRIDDQVTGDFPDEEQFRQARYPDKLNPNPFDRLIGYFRWLWLVARIRGLAVETVSVPVLAGGARVDLVMRATPLRRGVIRFDRVVIAGSDPLGLVNGLIRRHLPQSLMILPRQHFMHPISLGGSRRHQSEGVSLAQSVGNADEFVFLREFRSGDQRRHIHWRSSARRDKLVVREHQDEYHQRFALIVDTFAAPGEEEWLEDGIEIAASVIGATRLGESLLDMMFVGHQACHITAGRGLGCIENLLEVLACALPCRDHPFTHLTDLVLGHAGMLNGCLCVLLHWDEPRQALVRGLHILGVPVQVIVLVAAGTSPAPGVLADKPEHFYPMPAGAVAPALAALKGLAVS